MSAVVGMEPNKAVNSAMLEGGKSLVPVKIAMMTKRAEAVCVLKIQFPHNNNLLVAGKAYVVMRLYNPLTEMVSMKYATLLEVRMDAPLARYVMLIVCGARLLHHLQYAAMG